MKKYTVYVTLCSIGFVVLLITGCAKYRPRMMSYATGSVQEQENIEVATKALNDLECQSYFNRKIVKKGYQPIQVCIKNKTDKTYVLNANNIGLPIEKPKRVARRLHTNTASRVAGWSLGGLFFWPLFIPAIVDGTRSIKANKELDADLNERGIGRSQKIVIAPHSAINKVMFVKTADYRPHYSIDLTSKDDGTKVKFMM
jgi:hypothetical protein